MDLQVPSAEGFVPRAHFTKRVLVDGIRLNSLLQSIIGPEKKLGAWLALEVMMILDMGFRRGFAAVTRVVVV